MKKNNVRNMTIFAMFASIIVLLTFIPYIGYINLGFVSITCIHVVVIIGAILLGPKSGLILGIVFGISSLIQASSHGSSDTTFIFPWVSILPRAIFGWFVGFLYLALKKVIKANSLAIGLTAAIGTIAHTVLVFIPYFPTYVGMVAGVSLDYIQEGAIGYNNVTAPIFFYCLMVFGFNCIFETILAILVVTPVNTALSAFLTADLDTEEEE